MAKIPLKIISEQDYQDKEIVKLLRPLNDFIRAVTLAFQNGLTLQDNAVAKTVDIQFFTDGSSNITPLPVAITWDFQGLNPQHVLITKATYLDAPKTPIPCSATPAWTLDNGRVVVTGLHADFSASRSFLVRFLILA